LSRFNLERLENATPGKEVGTDVNSHAETQLNSNPTDVHQAHQYFQAGQPGHLPDLKLTGAAAGSPMGGIESAIAKPMPGAEGALGAVMPPGGEPISPLVQLIMKMPGLTGMMDSFFEFMGAILHGNLLDALNPADWIDSAANAITSIQDTIEHFALSLDMVPANGPVLHFDGTNFSPVDSSGMRLHSELGAGAVDSSANVGAPIEYPQIEHAAYEKVGQADIEELKKNSILDWHTPDQVALGEGNGYSPSSATYTPSSYGTPAQAPPAPQTHVSAAPAAHHATPSTHRMPSHGAAEHHAMQHHDSSSHQQSHPSETHHEPAEIAQAKPTDAPSGSSEYTIQSGDNLWDIARKQLGDGSRWSEIYKLNADVIGQNPDLIQPGAMLKMPEGVEVATGDYVVQPGDNLWNIARSNLGDGSRWSEIYQVNQGVIGSNPDLILPGQHLQVGTADGAAAVAAQTPHAVSTPLAQVSASPTQPTAIAANYPHSPSGGVQVETPLVDPSVLPDQK
jgi:nucleoid-associated protein YgaU